MTRVRVCALAVCAVLGASCGGAAMVDRVTVSNPTEFSLDVEVTSGERGGWLQVGHVRRGSSTTTQDVIDQGPVWIFRFSHLGRAAGELRITRAELARARWRIEVPATVAAALRDRGAEPSLETGE